MKISELMVSRVACCGPRASLAEAAEILWKRDCGVLPVVDEEKRLLGVITDRDICVALGTRNKLASDVPVEDVMSKNIVACSPDSDVMHALAIMHTHMLRRVPVVGDGNALVGILSLSAVARHAGHFGEPSDASVMNVLKRLSERRADESRRAAAETSASRADAESEPRVRASRYRRREPSEQAEARRR